MIDWQTFLDTELAKPYMQETLQYVADRRAEGVTVYPKDEQVFSAFDVTPLNEIKVVILGQTHTTEKVRPMVFVFRYCLKLKSYLRH